jgi:hypothetical protein
MAGFEAENLAKDPAHEPRIERDAKMKRSTFTRKKSVGQSTAWPVRGVGDIRCDHDPEKARQQKSAW